MLSVDKQIKNIFHWARHQYAVYLKTIEERKNVFHVKIITSCPSSSSLVHANLRSSYPKPEQNNYYVCAFTKGGRGCYVPYCA